MFWRSELLSLLPRKKIEKKMKMMKVFCVVKNEQGESIKQANVKLNSGEEEFLLKFNKNQSWYETEIDIKNDKFYEVNVSHNDYEPTRFKKKLGNGRIEVILGKEGSKYYQVGDKRIAQEVVPEIIGIDGLQEPLESIVNKLKLQPVSIYAVELSNTLAVSDRSPVSGPIQLVNSQPAEAPEIKKITTDITRIENRVEPKIAFELNDFVTSENIKQFQIFRATEPENALSVRTMTLAKTVDVGEDVIDDFSDQIFPLYGEPLFYRLVAYREIVNEGGITEMVPSQPSNVALTNIIDEVHPLPPSIEFSHDAPTGSPIQLNNVSLNFRQTAYNAKYFVYMQNSKGNWTLIKQITPADHNNTTNIIVNLLDTDLASGTLDKQDANLNPIYYSFRVDVENSSGLPNIQKKDYTL